MEPEFQERGSLNRLPSGPPDEMLSSKDLLKEERDGETSSVCGGAHAVNQSRQRLGKRAQAEEGRSSWAFTRVSRGKPTAKCSLEE